MATTTTVDHLLVLIVLAVKITVVVPHLPVTITILVIAATDPHLLVPLVHLSMTHTHHLLVAATVAMSIPDLLLVAVMMIRMPPMGMTDLGRDHHLRGATGDMKSALRPDTGECSSPSLTGALT